MDNSSDLNGENKTGSPWFKCFPTDWLDGTRHLSLEQRAAYIDILCIIYKTGKAVRDDDRWVAHQLMTTPRRWRSIRNALIADGKLVVVGDCLTNKRAEIEIENRVKLSRKLRETSANRERNKRENSKKQSEINKTDTTAVPQKDHYARASSDIRYQISESNSQIADTSSVAASGPEEIQGLNGTTAMIVEQFAKWLNPWVPDLELAHKSIAEACRIYGPNAVRDAFADLKADHRDGKVRALSHKAFYGYCRTAKDRKPKAAQPDRSNMVFKPSRFGAGKWVEREAVQ